jgi:dTDP-4-amino-4,6-dideoxygalactose transaminase
LKKLKNSNTAWHLYVLQINFDELGKTRTQFMQNLKNNGIGTQVHYIPLYYQPYYKNLYGEMSLLGAENYYKTCLSIPLYVGLREEDQNYIIQKIMQL